jgi:Mg/Co/Ni transporter MgtE
MRTLPSSALRSANRRLLWLLVLAGTSLFAGSILFIISRAH